jgi:lipoyl(octanoyl) transferase
VVRCGQVPYEEARATQKRLEAARHDGQIPDLLLLLEHPPVYTKGRRAEPGELPMGEDWYRMQGIEVCETDRGGRVTYHGPGQLVGYPIVSLRDLDYRPAPGREAEDVRRNDVGGYIRRMERLIIESLGAFGVRAGVIEGLTGVWTLPERREGGDATAADVTAGHSRKIGSIGVHVNRGVTTHGFAVNVNNDLQPFEWVVPCGIEGCRVTSLCRELGAPHDMSDYMDAVVERFGFIYARRPHEIEATELAERVAGVEPLVAAGPAASHATGNGTPATVR